MLDFAFLCASPKLRNGLRVGVIGAGPAGLFGAGLLACAGADVTVYERSNAPGGRIPLLVAARLDDALADVARKRVEDGARRLAHEFGVRFEYAADVRSAQPLFAQTLDTQGDPVMTAVGVELGFADAQRVRHDGALVCSGGFSAKRLCVPGEHLPGVLHGPTLHFEARPESAFSQDGRPELALFGQNLVVVGFGQAAYEAALEAVELGASRVALIGRESREGADMGLGALAELEAAGVFVLDKTEVIGFEGRGRVAAVAVAQLGRDGGFPRLIPADSVVVALGAAPLEANADMGFVMHLGLDERRDACGREQKSGRTDRLVVAEEAAVGPGTVGRAALSGLKAAQRLAAALDRPGPAPRRPRPPTNIGRKIA